MYCLGLTGSIASGKSTVLTMFEKLGYPGFAADDAVHQLYQGEAMAPISRVFPQAVSKQGVDRKILSEIITRSPKQLAELNAIVHPLVGMKMRAFRQNVKLSGSNLAVFDIPLLFETGHDYALDGVAVTWCDDEIQQKRALARPEMNVEKLKTILAHQMSQKDKKQRADFLIDTNKSLAETRKQVKKIADTCILASRGLR